MRRRLSYANVVATLALVFAMSGGALAANHYLINSTKQINPKVLKKLKGSTGKTGAAGATGATGPQGPTGKEGSPGKEGNVGKEGKEGKEGPYPVVLASGETETGVWGGGFTAAVAGNAYEITGSFPIPLPGALTAGNAIYVSGTSSTHCSGAGHAESGYLCLYQGYTENLNPPVNDNIFSPEQSGVDADAGANGFAILVSAKNAGLTRVSGTFAVTAP